MSEAMNEQVVTALKMACMAHEEQTDLTGQPYILHPLNVWAQFRDADPELQIVALLHDVFEDSDKFWQGDLVSLGFSLKVADAIGAITKLGGQEDYQEYLYRVSRNSLARKVKLADLRHNLRGTISNERRDKYHRAIQFLQKYEV